MDGREQGPSKDEIDYGTGEGPAYGGGDSDAPVFIPHPHPSGAIADNGTHRHSANANYSSNLLKRTSRTSDAFVRRAFSSAAAWSAFASIAVAITTVFYTIYAHRQWVAMSGQIEVMRDANGLTARALDSSGNTLQQTLDKMQGQIDATNRLYGEAQKQTTHAAIMAANSGIQAIAGQTSANAAKSAADTAKESLHVSQRAFLTVGPPQFDWAKGIVQLSIRDIGHIPSGKVVEVVHEVTLIYPASYFTKVKAIAHERHWNRISAASIFPSSDQRTLATTIPKADPKELGFGRQVIFVVGSLTYNDGFSDTPDHYLSFCYETRTIEKTNEVTWSACDANKWLPVVEREDGYPQKEDESQYP